MLVHRNAFPVTALFIEAAPQPLQALVSAGFRSRTPHLRSSLVEVSPVFTTD
jgi:hypothetical protein